MFLICRKERGFFFFWSAPISCPPNSLTFMSILQNCALQMKLLCVHSYILWRATNLQPPSGQPIPYLHVLPPVCVASPASAPNPEVRVFKVCCARGSHRLGTASCAQWGWFKLQQHPGDRCAGWALQGDDAPTAEGGTASSPAPPMVGNLLGMQLAGLTSSVQAHMSKAFPSFGFPISWSPAMLKDGI